MRDQEDLSEEESEINLTPMLDVVFIMLIFFIVTAVFVKDPGVEVDRPEALMTREAGAGSIYVAITPDDQVHIDRREVDISEVRYSIERLLAEAPEAGVVIQSDSDARNELVIRVMDAAKAAGVTDIKIAAQEP
ncbi:MAG: biopolymer transporter ExbD [Gammaproteobacteria bacterium]|nr:biopolymer transporter ExbD [Gammaproteobacteria bacterium]